KLKGSQDGVESQTEVKSETTGRAVEEENDCRLALQQEFFAYGLDAALEIGESMPELMDALTGMRVNIRTIWLAWEGFCQEQWHLDGLTVIRGNIGEFADEV